MNKSRASPAASRSPPPSANGRHAPPLQVEAAKTKFGHEALEELSSRQPVEIDLKMPWPKGEHAPTRTRTAPSTGVMPARGSG